MEYPVLYFKHMLEFYECIFLKKLVSYFVFLIPRFFKQDRAHIITCLPGLKHAQKAIFQ